MTDLYLGLMKQFKLWASENSVEYIDEVTSIAMERWYSSRDWTRLAKSTRHVYWGCIRSFFNYLHERKVISENPVAAIKRVKQDDDHRQGPYTDQQVGEISKAVEAASLSHINVAEKPVYRERLICFFQLLHSTGCDVIDALTNMSHPESPVPWWMESASTYIATSDRRLACRP